MANPQRIKARLQEIRRFGNDTYLLVFSVPRRSTRFLPGQFTHLTVDAFDPVGGYWPESRVFSIASEPRTDRLQIVYSIKGKYTQRMAATLNEGEEYWLKYPYGSFTVENCAAGGQDVVLIAGGTGISPFIPYLLDGRKEHPGRNVALFYGIRNASHFLFEDEIQRAKRMMPGLHVYVFSEQTDGSGKFVEGRLDIEYVLGAINGLISPMFFVSGPPAMIGYFQRELSLRGIDKRNIQIDDWGES